MPEIPPFVASRPPWRGLLLLALAWVGATVWLTWLDRPLVTDVSPWGILSLELVFDASDAQRILNYWKPHPLFPDRLQIARVGLIWDTVLYIPLYTLFLMLLARTIGDWVRSRGGCERWSRIGRALSQGCLIAGLLDWVENACLFVLLRQASENEGLLSGSWVEVGSTCAALKFLLIGATTVFVLAGICSALVAGKAQPLVPVPPG